MKSEQRFSARSKPYRRIRPTGTLRAGIRLDLALTEVEIVPSLIRNSTSVALGIFIFLLAIVAFGARATDAASCESLASVSLANVTITSAESVAAGAFTPP